jgi:hypothetical protein
MITLDYVLEMQTRVSQLHPIFGMRFPVAVLEDERLDWFEPTEHGFTQIKSSTSPAWLLSPIQAAFPLEGVMACVIDSKSLEGLDGAITVMHEFVHCHQYDTCESKLKSQLEVAQRATEADNHMWELEHPFPYNNLDFERLYAEQLRQPLELHRAREIRSELRRVLEPMDFEYMLWQEWKEGLARYFENLIRHELELPLASSRSTPPFDRVTFYAGGEALISLLVRQRPELTSNFEDLFYAMQI